MKKSVVILILSVFTILLAACQAPAGFAVTGGYRGQATQAEPTLTPQPTLIVLPTRQPTPAPADATETTAAAAEETARAYFAALQGQDFETASDQVSEFSLMVAGMTHGDVVNELTTRKLAGERWSGLEVQGVQVFDDKTVLVHVTYQLSQKDAESGEENRVAQDELWPLRQENGRWLYNWGNLIDFRTLDVAEQTTAGMTVRPEQILRYSDHLRLNLLVQNSTNDPIVWGQVNEVMGKFYFGDETVEAEPEQLIFDRLRSYPDVGIDVAGLYDRYPDKVDLRQWKNYQVAPWYSFQLEY
ncbi:MAG: hypothetical protein VB089_12630 [Anaerolineaceae bacterium]|nr:hypothetical protein [Anaerolineaceae bacterium]